MKYAQAGMIKEHLKNVENAKLIILKIYRFGRLKAFKLFYKLFHCIHEKSPVLF